MNDQDRFEYELYRERDMELDLEWAQETLKNDPDYIEWLEEIDEQE